MTGIRTQRRSAIKTKATFSPTDWATVLEGPLTAGLMLITASRGGMFRETLAMSNAYTEARAQHGASELLDQIIADQPRMDVGRYRTPEELKAQGLAHLRDAAAVLEHSAAGAPLATCQV